MKFKHHLDLTGAYERAKELEAEDLRLEREKMQRYQAMKRDPLWDLKAEIAETEKKLEALKEELYQKSVELSMEKYKEAGVRFIESSSGSEIRFLGRG